MNFASHKCDQKNMAIFTEAPQYIDSSKIFNARRYVSYFSKQAGVKKICTFNVSHSAFRRNNIVRRHFYGFYIAHKWIEQNFLLSFE